VHAQAVRDQGKCTVVGDKENSLLVHVVSDLLMDVCVCVSVCVRVCGECVRAHVCARTCIECLNVSVYAQDVCKSERMCECVRVWGRNDVCAGGCNSSNSCAVMGSRVWVQHRVCCRRV
jgi:hypothetical protein